MYDAKVIGMPPPPEDDGGASSVTNGNKGDTSPNATGITGSKSSNTSNNAIAQEFETLYSKYNDLDKRSVSGNEEQQKPEDNMTEPRRVVELYNEIAPEGKIIGVVVPPKYIDKGKSRPNHLGIEIPWNVALGMRLIAQTENLNEERFKSVRLTAMKLKMKAGVIPPLEDIEAYEKLYKGVRS